MNVRILHLIEGARQARGLTVIIDVFRAFTVEAYFAKNNAARIIPVGDVETALRYRAEHPGAVLCGERGGAKIEGFDYGNSPSQLENVDLTGKTVIHTTSAGTQGIVNASGADEILAGSLVAAGAIAAYIRRKAPEEVSLVCMGLAGKERTEEDTFCAEYLKAMLLNEPLPDLEEGVKLIKATSGAKFFDPAQSSVFPERDFHLSLQADTVPFVLRLRKDAPLPYMERIDVL